MKASHSTNQDIQALRGIAILMVLVQHFRGRLPTSDGLNTIFGYFAFWGGVDLFFVISGFVITLSLLNSTAVGNGGTLTWTDFKRFMGRRFRRLLPASWFWLLAFLVLLLVSPELATPEWSISTFYGLLSGLVGVANVYWSYCETSGLVYKTCTSLDVGGVYWSLSLEEQFYLVLAISLTMAPIKRVITVMLAGVAVLSFYQLFLSEMRFLSLSWALRPQGLVIGVGIALLYRAGKLEWVSGLPKISIAAFMALATLALCWTPASLQLSQTIFVLTVISASMVVAASGDGAISRGVMEPLVWIGNRSYSIYLSHAVVYHAMRKSIEATIGPDTYASPSNLETLAWMITAFMLVMVVGALSYRFIETIMWKPKENPVIRTDAGR